MHNMCFNPKHWSKNGPTIWRDLSFASKEPIRLLWGYKDWHGNLSSTSTWVPRTLSEVFCIHVLIHCLIFNLHRINLCLTSPLDCIQAAKKTVFEQELLEFMSIQYSQTQWLETSHEISALVIHQSIFSAKTRTYGTITLFIRRFQYSLTTNQNPSSTKSIIACALTLEIYLVIIQT